MNNKQKDSLAKYWYDLSKVMLTLAVIGNLLQAKAKFTTDVLVGAGVGLIASVILVYIGLRFERKALS